MHNPFFLLLPSVTVQLVTVGGLHTRCTSRGNVSRFTHMSKNKQGKLHSSPLPKAWTIDVDYYCCTSHKLQPGPSIHAVLGLFLLFFRSGPLCRAPHTFCENKKERRDRIFYVEPTRASVPLPLLYIFWTKRIERLSLPLTMRRSLFLLAVFAVLAISGTCFRFGSPHSFWPPALLVLPIHDYWFL